MNYWNLAIISHQLNSLISDQKLLKCFSNSIDEVYFEFENCHFSVTFYLGEIFFFFNQNKQSEGRLHKPQFKEIINKKVNSVTCHFLERSFEIKFENKILIFKCHQKKSNLILLNENVDNKIFRSNLESDKTLKLKSFNQIENELLGNLTNFTNPKLSKILEKCPFDNDFSFLNIKIITTIKENLKSYSLTLEKENLIINKKSKTLDEVTLYSLKFIKDNSTQDLKNDYKTKTQKSILEKEKYLNSNELALTEILKQRSFEEIGNILLSNAHLYVNESKNIKAIDIYNNKEIEIKLNEKLNLVENASFYFKKEKSKPKQIEILKEKIEITKKSIDKLKSDLEQIEQTYNLKSLKKIESNKETNRVTLPYRQFIIEGHEIKVGKNANSNDTLLSKYSKPNDYWFHAKDVAGSHVLLPYKNNLPKHIIEKAASIAAYYSSQKTQNLATVIFTQRKFVRKIKGADKGKVTVSKESTLLVKPELPE